MGCDIHGPWVYGKQTRTRHGGSTFEAWDRLAELDWDRDYCLFSYLADVRNDEPITRDDHTGVYEARGANPIWSSAEMYTFRHLMPGADNSDSGCGSWHEHRVSEDCHSQSWLTTDELVDIQIKYANHVHHWTGFENRPSKDLGLAIGLMRTAEMEGYTDVHIGFCFDN